MKKSFFKFLHVFVVVTMIAWTFGPSLGLLVNTASADEITPVITETQVTPVVVPTIIEPEVTITDATPTVEPTVEATITPIIQASVEQTAPSALIVETPAAEVLANPEVDTAAPTQTEVTGACISVTGATVSDKCFNTIQAAIDEASSGDTIKVYPGNYDETATNRPVMGANYQFGLFVGTDKNNLTIEGVDTSGNPITDALSVNLPYITTHATNNFGTSGIFISGNNIAIKGVRIGPNASGDNKTIEVRGDNFTLQYSVIDVVGGGSVYFNVSDMNTAVNKYNILNNIFAQGASLDIASGAGAGVNSPVTDRQIIGNTFQGADVSWALVSFTGTGGEAWFAYPVGGAVITGNNFSGGTQYIRARGTYIENQFDWKSYWDNNTFDKKVVDLSDDPTFSVQPFSYGTFTNVRRIGSLIQSEINNAQSGDTINIGAGNYEAFSVENKSNLTITGAGLTATLITPSTLINTGVAHKYLTNTQASVFINNSTDIVIGGMTIKSNDKTPGAGGPDAIVFWNSSTGSINNCAVTGIYVINGVQTGQGIAIDASGTKTSNLLVDNCNISGFQKNGIEALDGNGASLGSTDSINLTVKNSNISGAPTAAIAQNGILLWSRGGGTVTGTVDHSTISNFNYTVDNATAAGILAYGGGNIANVSNSKFSGNDYNISIDNSPDINAINNWWGSAVETDILSKFSGNVSYKPWYTDSSMTTLSSVATVSTLDQLNAALANTDISTINLTENIETPTRLVLSHPATINGNNNSIIFTGAQKDWIKGASNYVLQVYKTNATINNLKLTGGYAALFVNGSVVTLGGAIDVSGNKVGGIESSNGSVLTIPATTTLKNDSEAYALPTVWEDSIAGTTVVGGIFTQSLTVRVGQIQYYLIAGNAIKNIIVTDQATLLAALADKDAGIITIGNDFSVTEKINITRPVIIDGANKTISMKGNNPLVWNSATAYVFQVYGTTSVTIKDIKLTGGNAALFINRSTAALLGTIDVSGNGFGGIESSNGSVLTIPATTTLKNDSEAYALPTVWEDGITGTTVNGFTGTKNITIKPTQVQYYMLAGNAVLAAIPTPAPVSNGGGGGGGYVPTICSAVTYSEWGSAFNGLQYRTVLSQTPSNCSLSSSQIAAESRSYVASVEPVSTQITPVIETSTQTSTTTKQVLGVKVYTDGTLLKGANNKIYVVKGSALQYISSLKELANYKGLILKVDDATISSFAKTAVLGAVKYADGTLIKAKGDVKIYVIKAGKKVHIKSLVELRQYKGKTLTVAASELTNY